MYSGLATFYEQVLSFLRCLHNLYRSSACARARVFDIENSSYRRIPFRITLSPSSTGRRGCGGLPPRFLRHRWQYKVSFDPPYTRFTSLRSATTPPRTALTRIHRA